MKMEISRIRDFSNSEPNTLLHNFCDKTDLTGEANQTGSLLWRAAARFRRAPVGW